MRFKILLLILFALSLGVFFSIYNKSFANINLDRFVETLVFGPTFDIPISGTGSMYPTFPKGQGKSVLELSSQVVGRIKMYKYPVGFSWAGKDYFSYQIRRGDIVLFENSKTKKITFERDGNERGFIKRIVALAGEEIELRDGVVYVNSKPLVEPYTALPRSTYGGEFLTECNKYKVPDGYVFVMGDNRKSSLDSREELGPIKISDIQFIVPWDKQIGLYDKHFRNTDQDLSEQTQNILNIKDLIAKINNIRQKNGKNKLKSNTRLEQSASLRGKVILNSNDLSFEATRSGYTMEKSLEDAGYKNIIWGEVPILGHYDANEIEGLITESVKLRKFIEDPDFEDIGLSEVQGNLNSCPANIIVMHFGGYTPPNYSEETIYQWQTSLKSLENSYDSWSDVKLIAEYYNSNKRDVDRLLEILTIQKSRYNTILAKMKQNQWLSDEEKQFIDDEPKLAAEAEQLVKKLNSK